MNVFILIMLNGLYFLGNRYPKHMFEQRMPNAWLGTVLNILYFLLFAFFLVVVVNRGKTPFSHNIFSPVDTFWKKIKGTRILLVLAVQLLGEGLRLFLAPLLNLYAIDILLVIQWIAWYWILAEKEQNLFYKKKPVLITASLCAFFVALSCLGNVLLLQKGDAVFAKYQFASTIYMQKIANLDFLFDVKTFLLDTLLGCVLLIMHRKTNAVQEKPKSPKTVKTVTGVLVVLALATIINYAKMWVYPYAQLLVSQTGKMGVTHSNAEYFTAYVNGITVERIGATLEPEQVFQTYDNTVQTGKYGEIRTFSTDDGMPFSLSAIEDSFQKHKANGKDFSIYKNKAVCWIENDTPVVLLREEIPQQKQNTMLTSICKQLIQQNNWEMFEYVTPYLLQYAPDFIKPYIERYAQGAVTEPENEFNAYIRPEYVVSCAKEFLKNL